jgi:hypothetical protein
MKNGIKPNANKKYNPRDKDTVLFENNLIKNDKEELHHG